VIQEATPNDKPVVSQNTFAALFWKCFDSLFKSAITVSLLAATGKI
jgi:hypothetical protein